jgi:rubrerythrin
MKRTLVLIPLLFAGVFAIAAGSPLPRDVADLLQRSLVREREAFTRYELFARKADDEGFRGAAALFRAQAQAERTHAQRFTMLLQLYGVAVPAEAAYTPVAGTTRDNIATAAAAERDERDGAYRVAVEICTTNARPDIAEMFEQTRDSEVEHANLCAAAGSNLDSMKAQKAFYVCRKCGYTTDVKLSFCPVCDHKQAPAKVE